VSLGNALVRECVGVTLVGLAVLSALALWTHDPADTLFTTQPVQNAGGMLGAAIAAVLLATVGYAAFPVVLAAALVGGCLVLGRQLPGLTSRFWIGAPLLLVATATLPLLVPDFAAAGPRASGGGALGSFLVTQETWIVGWWGAVLLNATLGVIGVLAVTGVSTGRVLGALGMLLGWLVAGAAAVATRVWDALLGVILGVWRAVLELFHGVERGWRGLAVWREQRARRLRVAAARAPVAEVVAAAGADGEAVDAVALTPRWRGGEQPQIVDHSADLVQRRKARQETFAFAEPAATGPYLRPDTAIFRAPPQSERDYDHDSLIMNSRILEKKLRDFGVGGSVVKVHPGPVITMYEFEPASGIKVNKIVGLADDLALALRALSVRIIAPLPGKSVVGVEVANSEREVVYLRELLESEHLRNSRSLLPVALGKDIFGNPVDADLAKMPHLLVAGATGTGKSVFLNCLLAADRPEAPRTLGLRRGSAPDCRCRHQSETGVCGARGRRAEDGGALPAHGRARGPQHSAVQRALRKGVEGRKQDLPPQAEVPRG
jgi:S-DNA-T family DNA segregation ATPase FtsK/SpoIIIE